MPMGEVFAKFGAAAYRLKQQGYEVVNPVSLCSGSWSWKKCMKVCLAAMLKCDAVYLLPDWNDSKGAKIELEVAMATE